MESFFIADTHFDHEGIRIHCKGRGANLDEGNKLVFDSWNGVVGKKDFVYIIGDFAFQNHRKWINDLNGKKILIVGDHDDMPQDALDTFQSMEWRDPDSIGWKWLKESGIDCDNPVEIAKSMRQFREVHGTLVRKICGQTMHLHHWPQRSWVKSTHGSWCICGHSHGRMKETQPGIAWGGLILDVGWDVFRRPINFDELKVEMDKKFELMSEGFKEHVLAGKNGGRLSESDNPEHNPVGGVK